MKIRIGSRESRLAVIQAELLIRELRKIPGVEPDLVTMKTTGDRILDRTLDQVGGKGLFVKELDAALREGRVDLTVHSMKDLPAELPEDLPLLAVSRREDPRDALVLPAGRSAPEPGKPLGCASQRRAAQLPALFPGFAVRPVRGNVLTRLEKLDRGEYGALVLALAGLRRLGLEGRASRLFPAEELLPAACQGILAVQGRRDFDRALLAGFHDAEAALAARAERAFVRALGGGCSAPAAAYAVREGGLLFLRGFDKGPDGVWKGGLRGPAEEPEALGLALAEQRKEDAAHGA